MLTLIRFVVLGLTLVTLGDYVAAQGPARDVGIEAMRSERRVALVIGNAAYPTAGLRNPVNDARAMTAALKAQNFEVLAYENLGEKDMRRAIDAFGTRLRGSGVGFFYYSGHGLQVRGRNYLVPVDAQLTTEGDTEYEAIDVGRVLAKMDDVKNRLNILVLDACRNNPFEKAWSRGTDAGGLAQMTAPNGTFIAYATGPGRVASDGAGANGLYTSELLRVMQTPGLSLETVFKQVGGAVARLSDRAQEPWFSTSVYGEFVFTLPRLAPAPQVAIAAPPAPPSPITTEIEREHGTLAIRGKLAGIEVWLDDQRIGETPAGGALVLRNVPVGTHRLKARKAGQKEWERDVEVAANQRAEVVIDIEPLRPGPPPTAKTEDDAEMVLVPAGELWMGSVLAEVERAKEECKKAGLAEASCKVLIEREAPRHRVHLDAYYIDRYEVTNALFERFVRARSYRTTAEREGDGLAYQQKDAKWQMQKVAGASWRTPNGPGTSVPSDHPVVQVSWDDALAYCRWAGKRLPTEAEWEKAARGTDGRRYPWGEDWDSSRANGAMSVKATTAVGAYPNGASLYGVHDMAGNVTEWVADWFGRDYYQQSPERNPTGPASGDRRVLRGGSWYYHLFNLRSTFRYDFAPDYRSPSVGFRCARGLQP